MGRPHGTVCYETVNASNYVFLHAHLLIVGVQMSKCHVLHCPFALLLALPGTAPCIARAICWLSLPGNLFFFADASQSLTLLA